LLVFFFSSRRRHTSFSRDWSSDVCSSDLRLNELRLGGLDERGELRQVDRIRRLVIGGSSLLPAALHHLADDQRLQALLVQPHRRSEERRVGKEWRSGRLRLQ